MPIYPDKRNGKYTGRWRVEVQHGGRRLRKRANSKDEAQRLEKSLMNELKNGGSGRRVSAKYARPATLREAIEKARNLLWRNRSSEKINFSRLSVMAKILGEDLPLDNIDQDCVDSLAEGLLERGITLSTVNRYYSILGTFLKWCAHPTRRYFTAPMPSFQWNEESEGRLVWISEEEEAEIYRIAPEDIAKLVNVAIATGLRRNELLHLRREDVEVLPNGRGWIHLGRSKSGGIVTKNRKSRSVSVPARVMPNLLWLLDGHMPTASRLRYQWDRIRVQLGKGPEFVFHLCRHTCATRMVRAGIHLLTIKQHLGHLSLETTMRYAKVHSELLEDAVDRLPQVDISTVLT